MENKADPNPTPQVDKTLKIHEAPENYLQKYLPQNGGEIQADAVPSMDCGM